MNSQQPTVAIPERTIPPPVTRAAARPAVTAHLAEKASSLATFAFFLVVVLVLYEGWRIRGDELITAESGLGYALGILGGSMMLLLLVYPLRKRLRALRVLGAVKHWFRVHMLFGVLGPACIMFHSNFQLGSLNSNIALLCMLVVAGSGLLGRYFYAKIHHGLYGSHASLQELQQASAQSKNEVAAVFAYVPALQQRLKDLEAQVLPKSSGLLDTARRLVWLSVAMPWIRAGVMRECRARVRREISSRRERRLHIQEARRYLTAYFSTLRKVAEYSFYARLFSLWHVLHLPLFVMMIITGVVHVIAVHMY